MGRREHLGRPGVPAADKDQRGQRIRRRKAPVFTGFEPVAVLASLPCPAQPTPPTLQLVAVEPDTRQPRSDREGDSVCDPDVDADRRACLGLDPSRQVPGSQGGFRNEIGTRGPLAILTQANWLGGGFAPAS